MQSARNTPWSPGKTASSGSYAFKYSAVSETTQFGLHVAEAQTLQWTNMLTKKERKETDIIPEPSLDGRSVGTFKWTLELHGYGKIPGCSEQKVSTTTLYMFLHSFTYTNK